MAVLLRRGFYKDFNPNKLLAGELAKEKNISFPTQEG